MTHSGQEEAAARQDSQAGETVGRERRMVRLFCVLAALRLLVFLAAFPFFDNVDEHFHFDLVCKYSHGDVPRRLDNGDAEAAQFIALYTSPEYLYRAKDFPAMAIPPPLWSLPADEQAAAVEASIPWTRVMNHDATQPPVYYAAAGGWYNLGKLMGIRGRNLLYWTRLFNVPFYVLLVWLSYLLTKRLFPDSAFTYLGVPLLLAIFPQTVFYSLNSDVLSAPLVTLSLYWLVRMYQRDAPAPGFALGAGLSGAAAFLTKYTNAPILLIVGLVAALILWKSWRGGRLLGNLAPVAVLLVAASVPVGCWLAELRCLGRCHGSCCEGTFLDLDAQAAGRDLEPPDIHSERVRRLLERSGADFLARRVCLAPCRSGGLAGRCPVGPLVDDLSGGVLCRRRGGHCETPAREPPGCRDLLSAVRVCRGALDPRLRVV